MKYYTWKLKWAIDPETGSEEGTSPAGIVNNSSTRIDPQFTISGANKEDDLYYAICNKGVVIPSELTDWSVEEINSDEFLDAAKVIDPNVTMADGFLVFPLEENLGL